MIKVAINGFGRIGRSALKVALSKNKAIKVVAINDLAPIDTLAHLFKHDTVYGAYKGQVSATKKFLQVGSHKIRIYQEPNPAKIPWDKHKVDFVLECTGRFRDEKLAAAHLRAGAKRVIISAPTDQAEIPMQVLGVNQISSDHKIISNASCTTNSVAPVLAVLATKFEVKKAMLTTVHGYTADQRLQDAPHKDKRRARAAAVNLIPTSTGAAQAAAEVLPSFKSKFTGLALRVPVPVVSLSDLTVLVDRATSIKEINQLFSTAAKAKRWRGVLAVSSEELVSSDFIGNKHSAIVDLQLTQVADQDLVKIVAWYDNEWGYSNRLVELVLKS